MKKLCSLVMNVLFLFAIVSSFHVLAFAETVILKSGKTLEGKIIERTDKYIKIDFYGVTLTYYLDEIERIDGGSLSKNNNSNTIDVKPTNKNVYYNENFGIRITGPEEWYMIYDKDLLASETDQEVEDFKQYISSGKGFMVNFSQNKYNSKDKTSWENTPNITVIGFYMPIITPNISSESYADSVINELKNDTTIKIIQYPTKLKINNKEWFQIMFLEQNILKAMMCYYVDLKKGISYTYSCVAKKEVYDLNKDHFDNTLKSIELVD